MLYVVKQGDQGLVEKNNRVEFIQYDKITVKLA
jgi:hypothetical protein